MINALRVVATQGMNKSIEILLRGREEMLERHRRELQEIDSAIAALRREDAADKRPTSKRDIAVRPGQYAGMKPAAALQAYLNERNGGPAKIKERVVEDLRIGQAKLGQDDREERNIRIAITHNPKIFYYDKHEDTVMLISARKPN